MLATALLTITTAAEHDSHPPPDGQIRSPATKFCRLLGTLIIWPQADQFLTTS
jgi:hypothetical protein